jgi:hypothetical protein
VGVILYEMLTGERLFVGESDFSTLEKVRNAEVLPPRQYNAQIPEGLEKIVMKALAKELEERYQYCSDFQEDLMRYLLSGDQIYSSKQMAGFMKEAFVEDLNKEKDRLERFATVQKPDAVETSGLTNSRRPAATGTQRKSPLAEVGVSTLSGADALKPEIPPLQAGELDEQPRADRTEIFRPAFTPEKKGPGARSGRQLGDDDESTATPTAPPEGDGEVPSAEAATLYEPAPDEDEPGSPEVAKTMIGVSSPLATPPQKPNGKAPPKTNGKAPRRPTMPAQDLEGADTAPPEAQVEAYGGETVMGVKPPVLTPRKPPVEEEEPIGDEGEENPDETGPSTIVPNQAALKGKSKLPLIAAGVVVALVGLGVVAKFALAPKEGVLALNIEPKSAQVSVNKAGYRNGTQVQLPAGVYDVSAKAEGYQPKREKVTLAAGQLQSVDFVLEKEAPPEPPPKPPEPAVEPGAGTGEPKVADQGEPKTGEPGAGAPKTGEPTKVAGGEPPPPRPADPIKPSLKVESAPPGAEIEINGKKMGKTPKVLAGLDPVKVSSVKLTLRGYKTATQSVIWTPDAPESAVVVILDQDDTPPPPRPVVQRQPQDRPQTDRPPKAPPAPKGIGKLVTGSTPVAKVLIDGKDSGRWTPVPMAQPIEVPAGDHTITYVAADGRKATRPVTITPNEISKVVGVNDFE